MPDLPLVSSLERLIILAALQFSMENLEEFKRWFAAQYNVEIYERDINFLIDVIRGKD
jgi:hypothetical protein